MRHFQYHTNLVVCKHSDPLPNHPCPPPGLPPDVRQWTVSQVVQYFRSTSDCASYVDLFESQEVDGIALLLLTHETLVKCLGIKLGRAVKIMNRVQELKCYYEHYQASK